MNLQHIIKIDGQTRTILAETKDGFLLVDNGYQASRPSRLIVGKKREVYTCPFSGRIHSKEVRI